MYTEEFLSHHGIKGQKYGVRRFQNLDRTWTEAGKLRYGDNKNKSFIETPNDYAYKAARLFSEDLKKAAPKINEKLHDLEERLKPYVGINMSSKSFNMDVGEMKKTIEKYIYPNSEFSLTELYNVFNKD